MMLIVVRPSYSSMSTNSVCLSMLVWVWVCQLMRKVQFLSWTLSVKIIRLFQSGRMSLSITDRYWHQCLQSVINKAILSLEIQMLKYTESLYLRMQIDILGYFSLFTIGLLNWRCCDQIQIRSPTEFFPTKPCFECLRRWSFPTGGFWVRCTWNHEISK